jgi:hypothetical protein
LELQEEEIPKKPLKSAMNYHKLDIVKNCEVPDGPDEKMNNNNLNEKPISIENVNIEIPDNNQESKEKVRDPNNNPNSSLSLEDVISLRFNFS